MKRNGFIGDTIIESEGLIRFLERTINETKILIEEKKIELENAKVGTRKRNEIFDELIDLREQNIQARLTLLSLQATAHTSDDLMESLNYISMN